MRTNHNALLSLYTAITAIFMCCGSLYANTNAVPDLMPPLPSNVAIDQSGTIAGLLGSGSTNGVFASAYKGASDALAFVEGVTNGFARVTLEGYFLHTKTQGNGGGGNFYVPLSGTNNIFGAGFGIAYLNKQWYDSTLTARLGDSVPLPLKLNKIFPLYAYLESGGGYNFGTKAAIAQGFVGSSLHYALFRTKSGNTFDFTVGYAIGTISDIKGNVEAGGGSFTWTF